MEDFKEGSLSFENCGPAYLFEGLRVIGEVSIPYSVSTVKGNLALVARFREGFLEERIA